MSNETETHWWDEWGKPAVVIIPSILFVTGGCVLAYKMNDFYPHIDTE